MKQSKIRKCLGCGGLLFKGRKLFHGKKCEELAMDAKEERV